MKKSLLLVLLLLSSILYTGCAKNYKTVSEYAEDMAIVKNRAGSYRIEAVVTTDDADTYCNSFIKGDKWKTETSKNSGKTYQDGILYDGSEVYSYSKKQNIAMSIPFKLMMKKQGVKDTDRIELAMKIINPTGVLVHWNILDESGNLDNMWAFGKKNEKKNDFPCRMLKNKDGSEICVSDKYGIAVYAKIIGTKNGKNAEFNVKKISTAPLTEYDMELPAGVRKISMADMFQNLAQMMKQ